MGSDTNEVPWDTCNIAAESARDISYSKIKLDCILRSEGEPQRKIVTYSDDPHLENKLLKKKIRARDQEPLTRKFITPGGGNDEAAYK